MEIPTIVVSIEVSRTRPTLYVEPGDEASNLILQTIVLEEVIEIVKIQS